MQLVYWRHYGFVMVDFHPYEVLETNSIGIVPCSWFVPGTVTPEMFDKPR